MPVTLTTELDAVNTLLDIIGESPVNTVDDSGVVDAVKARNLLREVSLEVQSRGWHWNTDKGLPLVPTVAPDGFLMLPSNVLQVNAVDRRYDLTQRGNRLYDRRAFTYTFDGTVKVDLVKALDFDELPQAARTYIVIRAGRIFQDRTVGSKELNGMNEKDELRALVTLQNHEAETAGYSLLRDNNSVQESTVRNIRWRT